MVTQNFSNPASSPPKSLVARKNLEDIRAVRVESNDGQAAWRRMLQLGRVPYDYYDPLIQFQKWEDSLAIVGVLCIGSGQQHLEFLLTSGLYVPFKQIARSHFGRCLLAKCFATSYRQISRWLEPIALPHQPLDNRDFVFKKQRDVTIVKHLHTGHKWEVNNADLEALQREVHKRFYSQSNAYKERNCSGIGRSGNAGFGGWLLPAQSLQMLDKVALNTTLSAAKPFATVALCKALVTRDENIDDKLSDLQPRHREDHETGMQAIAKTANLYHCESSMAIDMTQLTLASLDRSCGS
ncbi:hypothetical protein LTR49_026181 [Elasticomyces elasticus]|nr:hypothetical protein LTR49_026181 [Elasticomyces elasticus]